MTFPRRRSKHGNITVKYDGYTFGSKGEKSRYIELRAMERAGMIRGLYVHPVFSLIVNGNLIGKCTPDSKYLRDGLLVVEDVKALDRRTGKFRTTEGYRYRKKLMWACHRIEVQEVAAPIPARQSRRKATRSRR